MEEEGCQINGEAALDTQTRLTDLALMDSGQVVVRIGNKPDAKNQGGFNLFGKHFGDYNQDILFSIEYTLRKR